MCRYTSIDPEELRVVVAAGAPSRPMMLPSSSDPERSPRPCDEEDEMRERVTQKQGRPLFCMAAVLFFVGVAIGTYVPQLLHETASDAVDSSPEIMASSLSRKLVHRKGQTKDEIEGILVPFLSKPSPGRDQVVELIIDEFTSPLSPEKETSDRLDNAIDALEALETDGLPVAIKDHPFLFVGSVGASLNHEALQKKNITHIVNFSATARCNVHDGVKYLCFHGIRSHKQLLAHTDYVDRGVEFIESARLSGGRAMSHCWYGKNRSVTLLVAYLMKYEGMTAAHATRLIQKTRPEADPYMDVLRRYAKRYVKNVKKFEDDS